MLAGMLGCCALWAGDLSAARAAAAPCPRPHQIVCLEMRVAFLGFLAFLLPGCSFAACQGSECESSEASLLQTASRMSCSPIPSITCDAQSGQMPQAHSKKQMKLVKDLDPSIGLSAWNCSLCLNDPNAATIYGVERWDGLGQRAASLINFMALAAHLNLNFGGLLPNPSEREHGVYIPKCMTELLGTNYKGIRRLAPEPHFDVCLFGPEAIQEAISQSGRPFGPHQSILIEECGNGREFVDYLTPEFQQRLRQATLLQRSKAVHFAGKAIHVAVHVRRGDLNNHEHWAHRNVADEIYMGLVEAVKDALAELHRSAEVHVFSSTEGGAYSSKDFDGYRSQEMRVHLNGEAQGS